MLKKVEVSGGVPIALCRVIVRPRFSTWLPDGRIVFSGETLPLQVVPSAGGTAEALLPLDEGETDQLTPTAVPGRSAIVFQSSLRGTLTAYNVDTKAGIRSCRGSTRTCCRMAVSCSFATAPSGWRP